MHRFQDAFKEVAKSGINIFCPKERLHQPCALTS
jgi:hypothetical protein